MTAFIADIASFQAGLMPAALVPDCAALEIKCTQGDGYADPDYADWLPEARAAGLLPVAYHWVDGSAPAGQAAWLKAHILDITVPVMLDFEEGGLQQALETCDAMTAAGLRPRLLYLARSFWQSLGSPDLSAPLTARNLGLINASYPRTGTGSPAALYPGDSAPQWDPYGAVAPLLWQYTDAALESGQRIDMNAYRGTGTQLAAFLGESAPAAPGTPAPAASGWPVLQQDASGYWVAVAQRALMLAGVDPKGVDGRFGADTLAAVEDYQGAAGFARDGVVGSQTWGGLRARTLAVQQALARIGLGAGGTDGVAGPLTAQEADAAQSRFGLVRDGVVGPATSRALDVPTI